MAKVSKRTRAIALINNGEWTKESLMKELDLTKRGLDTMFCYMRMGYRYPHADPKTGVLTILTEEQFNARKEIERQKRAMVKFHDSSKYRKSIKEVEEAADHLEEITNVKIDDAKLKRLLIKEAEINAEIAKYWHAKLINDFYHNNSIDDQIV